MTIDLPVAIHAAYVIGVLTGGFIVGTLIAAILAWRRRG